VYGRLSEVKDWFSNGVDEIAASHSLYTCANRSGAYFVACDNEKPCLALRFAMESGETKTLRGKSLDQFILHLNLIQNENNVTANEIQVFIDQFQVLSSASGVFFVMENVGYSTLDVSDFTCRAGFAFLDDAKTLKRICEDNMLSFKTWQSHTRLSWKISLLFWTEEMHDIYNAVYFSPDYQLSAQTLMEYCFRLWPLWNKNLDMDGRLSVHLRHLVASILSMKGRSFSWLEEVSRLINGIHLELVEHTGENESVLSKSEIVLHSLCCVEHNESISKLAILQQIYKVRLPRVSVCFLLDLLTNLSPILSRDAFLMHLRLSMAPFFSVKSKCFCF
jgi:hypothetical protein